MECTLTMTMCRLGYIYFFLCSFNFLLDKSISDRGWPFRYNCIKPLFSTVLCRTGIAGLGEGYPLCIIAAWRLCGICRATCLARRKTRHVPDRSWEDITYYLLRIHHSLRWLFPFTGAEQQGISPFLLFLIFFISYQTDRHSDRLNSSIASVSACSNQSRARITQHRFVSKVKRVTPFLIAPHIFRDRQSSRKLFLFDPA